MLVYPTLSSSKMSAHFSSIGHFCLGGPGSPDCRSQARFGIPQIFPVPDNRVQVVGIEMRLVGVPLLYAASVDDRAAQPFGEPRLPIGAVVGVGEVGNHEACGPQCHAKPVVDQAGRLAIGQQT